MRSRFWSFTQVVLLAAAFAIIPACKSNNKLAPPVVTGVLPGGSATSGIALMPNIIVQFDRDMDPVTTGNKANYGVFAAGAASGIQITVEYLPAVRETRIIPQSFLSTNPPVTSYTVVISGLVTSSAGTQMGSNVGFTFDTKASNASTTLISFDPNTIVASDGVAGQIVLTWTKATVQQGATTVDVTTYDVYMSTVPGGEDLLLQVFQNGTTTGFTTPATLTTGTIYYFKVQPRDADGNVFTTLPEVSRAAP